MSSNVFQSALSSVKHWYLLLIVGLIALALGIYMFTVPAATYAAVAIVFAWSFLISGVFQVIFSIVNYQTLPGWGWHLVGGLLNILVGYWLWNPAVSMAVLPLYIGFMVMFYSFLGMGVSFDLKGMGFKGWVWVLIFSILGVVFSFFLIKSPDFAASTVVVWTGLAFICIGLFQIAVSFMLKDVKNSV